MMCKRICSEQLTLNISVATFNYSNNLDMIALSFCSTVQALISANQ